MDNMGTIGLLGGMSHVATVPYYMTLNNMVAQRLGGYNSAQITIHSVNYHRLKSNYYNWDIVTPYFIEEYNKLAAMKPDCIVLACNTLHKAFDQARTKLERHGIPFMHAVELTGNDCQTRSLGKLLFLGTKFTMQDDYFTGPLRKMGIDLVLPTLAEQGLVQDIQARVVSQKPTPDAKDVMTRMIEAHKPDGIILACTELPIAFLAQDSSVPLIDPMMVQCQKAVDLVLNPNRSHNIQR